MGKSELKAAILTILRPEYPYSVCDLRSHCQRHSKTMVTRLAVTKLIGHVASNQIVDSCAATAE